MKIENGVLYINKIDLDHILGVLEGMEIYDKPPSELFKDGLEMELKFNGLEDKAFKDIVIENIWGE